VLLTIYQKMASLKLKPTTSAIARSAEHGSPGLEFEDVVAAPRQDVEICQRAADSTAATAMYDRVARRGIR
jgi:hypothetical protein